MEIFCNYGAKVTACDKRKEENFKEIAEKYVDAFIAHAEEKGSVNVFGIELGANAFEGLKDILASKFKK